MKVEEMTNELPPDLTAFVKSYLISFLMLLNLEADQMGYLLGAVFVDTFFGLVKSKKLGDSLSWDRFIWGMIKKFSILFIPFLLALLGKAFKLDLLFIVQGFIYILAANESMSILGNIASIYSGRRYENVDVIEKGIHMIIDWLTAFANSILVKAERVIQALKGEKK